MDKDYFREYLEIVDLARDYLRDGWKREHEPLGESGGATTTPVASGGDGSFSGKKTNEARESADQGRKLAEIASQVSACTHCRLAETRTFPVPGEGPAGPKVMIIGEAPGGQEDETGRPFVGRAGQYLDKWLAAIDLNREEDVFIGNIIKCRPPENRDPFPDEQAACIPYLERQVDLIQPYAILAVGRISTHILTGAEGGIGKLHGRQFSYRGIPLIPTYHPSGVLRNPQYRKPVWEDLKKLRALIDGGE